jgi:PadR family transcriptional regulator PadR
MGKDPRITKATIQVLSVLLQDPGGDHYGLEVAKQADLPTGSVYPILARLEQYGWVDSAWEEIDPAVEGRRPRRYYRLNVYGAQQARRALTDTMRLIAQSLRPATGRTST